MTTVANQEIAKVNKEICDETHIYAKINVEAMFNAMKDLSPIEFQVWLYFAKNQEGYEFAVSPAAALKEAGIKRDSFQRAKRVLKDKGYLVLDTNKGSNYYNFYEKPIDDEIIYVVKK